jgi:DNA-binding transcriptional ArsR family regulator
MLTPTPSSPGAAGLPSALVFAALGDVTRLSLVTKLSGGQPHSIARLTEGSTLTRQAITKHLHVLESAGLVRSIRSGRESLYKLDPQPLDEARQYLAYVSQMWDQPLSRLKALVEED